MIKKYWNKISGPLLDRIDIHMEVIPVPFSELSKQKKSESSKSVRARVNQARAIQENRFSDSQGLYSNAQMSTRQIREICMIDKAGQTLLKNAIEKLGLSARAYDRILKVARTIADLEEENKILPQHLAEAIQYRNLDRESWGN